MRSQRGVFLDRDGILNEVVERDRKPFPPMKLDEVRLIEGARLAVSSLRLAGFVTICVTNQPDVARGVMDRRTADAINNYVASELRVDDLIACFHDDSDGCTCRKPLPGMLIEAAARWSLRLEESYLVGDRWRDIDAGTAAGCRTVLVDRGWAERSPAGTPTARARSPLEAARWILRDARRAS